MLSDVLEIITATGAPGVTTDKLYNVSGTLFWNGTDLTAGGGGGGTRIEDTATDTFVDTENGGVNSKNLRLETGITAGNDGGTLNIVTGAPNSGVGFENGGDMSINLGSGYAYGGGGSLNITTGYGGNYNPSVGGTGGNVVVTLGKGYGNNYGGGFFITCGEAGPVLGGNGGSFTATGGSGATYNGTGGTMGLYAGNGGGDGVGGPCKIYAGSNTGGSDGDGGDISLRAGSGHSGAGVGGHVILQPGTANTVGDIKLEPPGGGTEVTVRVGTGVPTHSAQDGSLFLRTDGGSGTTLYVREAGSWVAK